VTLLSEHPAIEHFRNWLLRGLSGCTFAATLAGNENRAGIIAYAVIVGEPTEDDVPDITAAIDSTEEAHKVAVLLFPHLRSAEDIARLIRMLCQQEPRWSCYKVDWRNHARDDAVLLALPWMTRSGFVSDTMGFAPLGSMPVTRRSPYVALALWAGGHENPFMQKNSGPSVGISDTRHFLHKDQHKSLLKSSTEQTSAILSDPADDMEHLRKVAFCIPRDVAAKNEGMLSQAPDISPTSP
jgi:hypothetical protein